MMELAVIGLGALAVAVNWRLYFHKDTLIRAACFVLHNDHQSAQATLKRARKIPAFGAEVNHWSLLRNLLAYLEIREGRHEAAQELVDSVLERKGRLLPAIRGLIFDRVGELKAAEGLLREANSYRNQAEELLGSLDLAAQSPAILTGLAYFLTATGRDDCAADCFEEVVERNWSSPIVYMSWFATSRSQLPSELKLARCRRAIKYVSEPKLRDSLLVAVVNHEKALGNDEDAIEACNVILEQTSNLAGRKFALFMRAELESDLERLEEAAETRNELESLLDLSRSEDLAVLATLALLENHHRGCRSLLERAGPRAELEPLRALNAVNLGEATEALEMAEAGLASSEASSGLLIVAGIAALACLRSSEAWEYLRRAHAAGSKEANRLMAHTAIMHRGNLTEAKEWYEGPIDSEAHYRGQFALAYSLSSRELRSAFTAGPRLEALVAHQRASYQIAEERWEEALELFEMSRPVLVGAPLTQATSELYQLLCRDKLGEDVQEKFLQLQQQLEREFPGHPRFLAELRLVALAVASPTQVLELADQVFETEPRAFSRAEILHLKAQAQLSCGLAEPARQTLKLVSEAAPESFLDIRAREQLEQFTAES